MFLLGPMLLVGFPFMVLGEKIALLLDWIHSALGTAPLWFRKPANENNKRSAARFHKRTLRLY